MQIRRETAADRVAADEVHRRGFGDEGPVIARLLTALRAMPPSASDLALVVKLPAYEDWMSGTLVYAREFWDNDCVGLREPVA